MAPVVKRKGFCFARESRDRRACRGRWVRLNGIRLPVWLGVVGQKARSGSALPVPMTG